MTTNLPPYAGAYDGKDLLVHWMEAGRKAFGDIYHATIYGGDVYVVCRPEYAEHVLRRNWQNYRKGLAIKRIALLLGTGLMVSEGQLWKRQRRMMQPAFHQRNVSELSSIITSANLALLRKWEEASQKQQSIHLTSDISLTVLEITLRALFGDDYQEVAPHFHLLSEEPTRDMHFAQKFRSLGRVVAQVAARRRNDGVHSMDLIRALMEARDRNSGEAMSESQLVSEVMTLIVAGHETTASTLNLIWYSLSQNPEAEQKLHAELAHTSGDVGCANLEKYRYALQVIEEAMRMYPAGWLMTRRAIQEDTIGAYSVPAGTEVYISPYIIQRHPDLWPSPDRFDPDRFDPARFDAEQSAPRHPLTLLPFSAGPRNCIGEHLARSEMLTHLVMIGRRLRLRYDCVEPLELEFGVNLRSRHDLSMVPTLWDQAAPHHPPPALPE